MKGISISDNREVILPRIILGHLQSRTIILSKSHGGLWAKDMGSPSKGCGLSLQDCGLSESRLGFTGGCRVSDRDNPPDPHIANPKSQTPQQVQQGKHMEISSASLVIRKMHIEVHLTPRPTRTVTFSGWSIHRASENVEEWETHMLLWEWTLLQTLC